MSFSQLDRSQLTLAAAISLTLWSAQLAAQDTGRAELEEVVVTGSFLRGTPEDTAVPVEVVSYEEIQNMGRPSNLDLVKLMSESGGVAGENNRANFYPVGAATINLRSLGSRFTTVVFNGRRFPEQFSVNTGRFNNITWIPNAAVGSVETLKAGGAATYGADAIAGVVNYVTRKGFEGLELNGDYRYIEDSDGDYGIDMLWGTNLGAAGELLVSASYQHRSALNEIDRDFAQLHMLESPNSWQSLTSAISNPGTVVFQRPVAGAQTSFTPTQVPGNLLHMSAGGSVRDVGCAEIGGFRGWTNTPTPGCYTNTAETEELVTEQESYNLYIEHNLEAGGLRFHTEALAYRQDIPNIALAGTFVNNPDAWPLAPSVNGAPRVQQNINGTNAYFVPGTNPAVANLLNDLRNPDGSTAFTAAQIAAITNPANPGRVGLQNFLWKPFGNGGSPRGDVDRQEGHLKMYRLTEAIGGDLPQFWGTNLEWEVALTYSYTEDLKEADDILVTDMQAALNGFGGPNCSGTTAGANGCQWFNPFSSALERNVFTGAVNPYFESALANSRELVDWLYNPVWFKRVYKNYVVDPIVRGDTGIELPGGPIKVAFGGQFRRQDERVTMDAVSNRNNNPCTEIGVTNCDTTALGGVWLFDRQQTVFGGAANDYRPDARHFPVVAGFLETQLPLLRTLDLNVAGRYEKFYSDVTDIDNDIFVPAAAIKWQPLDWLGFRTSAGRTFSQVNPPRERDAIFGNSPGSTRYIGLGSGTLPDNSGPATYSTFDFPNVDVKPEKGEYFTVGFLLNAGNFMANVDYYDIEISDYTRTMTVANVVDTLAVGDSRGRLARELRADELRQRVAHPGNLGAGRTPARRAALAVRAGPDDDARPGRRPRELLRRQRADELGRAEDARHRRDDELPLRHRSAQHHAVGRLLAHLRVGARRLHHQRRESGGRLRRPRLRQRRHRAHQPVGREVPCECRNRVRDRPPHAEHSEPVRAGDHQRGSHAVHGASTIVTRTSATPMAYRRAAQRARLPARSRRTATACRPVPAQGSTRRTRRSSVSRGASAPRRTRRRLPGRRSTSCSMSI